MTFEIRDEHGKTLEKSDELEDCAPLDFVGLDRGTYSLLLQGYDEKETKLWEDTCTDLELGRFDVLYQCQVNQIADDSDGDDMDAGVPDAG